MYLSMNEHRNVAQSQHSGDDFNPTNTCLTTATIGTMTTVCRDSLQLERADVRDNQQRNNPACSFLNSALLASGDYCRLPVSSQPGSPSRHHSPSLVMSMSSLGGESPPCNVESTGFGSGSGSGAVLKQPIRSTTPPRRSQHSQAAHNSNHVVPQHQRGVTLQPTLHARRLRDPSATRAQPARLMTPEPKQNMKHKKK